MAKITINGVVCEFEGKPTILQVALENDIEIPHYCYHPGLSIVANCRICLAEVAQPDPRQDGKLSLIPKLLPTCQTPAVDGAEVYTDSPKAKANQQAVMEYLLINHPLDCPICDQAGECYLQDYSYKYGKAYSRFEEDKSKNPKKDLGPHILLYADRCIMCTRCVRFCREVTGTNEIYVDGRGYREEIDVFPGKPLDNELSGCTADICPVGALLDKDFLFDQRVWYLHSSPSIDGITASGDNIWVDHNEGRVFRLKPRTQPEINKWWISDEIRYGWKFVHREDRLVTPRIRKQDPPREATWDDARRAAVDGLKKAADGGRLALMLSPMIACEEAYLLTRLIRQIDNEAVVGLGPVPRQGEDKTFPGGYRITAEKAPNARGVKRAAQLVLGENAALDHAALLDRLQGDEVAGVLLTGNYPSGWVTDDLAGVADGRFAVLLDTLPTKLTDRVDVLLPSVTWVEKAGTFENIDGRLQGFEQAIDPIDGGRAEGQIAHDLLARFEGRPALRYEAHDVREQMGGGFNTDVELPVRHDSRASDVEFVEI